MQIPIDIEENIRNGKFSDKEILIKVNEGRIILFDLKEKGVISYDHYIKLEKEYLKQKISGGRIDFEEIETEINRLGLNFRDFLRELELSGKITNEKRMRMLPAEPIPVDDLTIFEDVPPIKIGPYDLFVLGLVSSGKSHFLAGLIYYGLKAGRLRIDNDNNGGFQYAAYLKLGVQTGRPLIPTPETSIQYISCDLMDSGEMMHPLNILEMSGEVFQVILKKDRASIVNPPPGAEFAGQRKLAEYLFNSNKKIFFLALDSNLAKQNMLLDQTAHFINILQHLDKLGVMKKATILCLLVTKWDLYQKLHGLKDDEGKKDFLDNDFKGLFWECKECAKRNNLKFEIFFFSLGEYDKQNYYTYKKKDSSDIFQFLVDATGYKKENDVTPWWKKIIGLENN